MFPGQQALVAIPVRNEEGHLATCLDALRAQTRPADGIVLLLNNCTDASLEICRAAGATWPALHVVECRLEGDEASAGEARRRAFAHAQDLAPEGVILTTDADATVPAGWIADNMAALNLGADCVCGMARIGEVVPDTAWPGLMFDNMRETFLLQLQDEIAAAIDPDPADPWPRHQQNSGASIAVRAAALRRAGGAPRIACGEDRALVAALAMVDARIRHAPEIRVGVSARLQGRAAGGMADTISRRLRQQDALTDAMLEPSVDAYRRVLTRVRLRAARDGEAAPEALATDLLMPPQLLRAALQAPHFGAAWAQVQQNSPILRRQHVAYLDLARETRQALALLEELRAGCAAHEGRPVGDGLRHAM